ncbi:MAG: PilZ domain-containing protein [Planctomycetota bacterium]|nr:MAG: PilZ domain-containing protein [Planctomycetota bacterium]
MSSSDRRRDFRADLRTVATLYLPEAGGSHRMREVKAWTEDVSATGARLMTQEPINVKQVWLKFFSPGQSICIIEAEVVRETTGPRNPFRRNEIVNWYGVRFLKMLTENEFMELAMDQVARLTSGVTLPEQAVAH